MDRVILFTPSDFYDFYEIQGNEKKLRLNGWWSLRKTHIPTHVPTYIYRHIRSIPIMQTNIRETVRQEQILQVKPQTHQLL